MSDETKKPQSRAPRSLKTINLDHLEHQARNILARDIDKLLVTSFSRSLTDKEALLLVNYIKSLREMKKAEREEFDNLSDEELDSLASKA